MQRRAAAAYVALLVVVSAGAFAASATATPPDISVDADHELQQGQSKTIGGTTYTVASLNASKPSATLESPTTEYENRTLEDGQVVQLDGANWSVRITQAPNPTRFRLVENFTVAIQEPTTTINGTVYVVLDAEGDERRLVPRDQYIDEEFGEPRTRQYREGGTYNGTDIATVTNESVTLSSTSQGTASTTVTEGANVTLGGTTYTAHFEGERLQLTSDREAYMDEAREIEEHHDVVHGLQVVSTLSGLAAFLLLAMAYMPVRGD